MSKSDTVAPHPPLTDYYADEDARHRWLRTIFNASAVDYDRIERLMAFGTGPWYRRQALRRAGLAPGMQVVDVGTGTGLTAIQAARLTGGGANVTGVDPSVGMLANARLPEGMRVIEGRAEALPVADSSCDFLSMGYALRHVPDLHITFREYRRVLKPGGRLLILEITPPSSRLAFRLLKLYLGTLVPLMARLGRGGRTSRELMEYYWDTIEMCVPPQVILDDLEAVGFSRVGRYVENGIFSEYTAVA